MPCLDISTNVDLKLSGIDSTDHPIFDELTQAVSRIIGRPPNLVMILLKGSVALTFGGNNDPAALAEIVAMDEINSETKKKLIVVVGSILHNQLSIPGTRFVLKIYVAKSSKL